MYNNVKSFKEYISEDYDFVSQFRGDHHGSPMEKNAFLNNLGLDVFGIQMLETWVNSMVSDTDWKEKTYPNKTGNYVNIIRDIKKVVGDLPKFVEENKKVNLIKISNHLKYYISNSK